MTSASTKQDSAIVVREFEGQAFRFREDGFFNMTAAAKTFGKRLDNFMRSPATKEYMDALRNSLNLRELTVAAAGHKGGTYAHPKLAVFFARWLSPRFAVWCDAAIDDLLRGRAELTVTKPEESALAELARKAEHHDRFLSAKGRFNFTQAAKMCGLGSAQELRVRLEVDRIVYRTNGSLVPTARFARKGLFHKRPVTAYDNAPPQLMLTAKGVAWLQERYGGTAAPASPPAPRASVRDGLKALVSAGRLHGPAGKLRPAADLGEELGVAHLAVVKALKALDRDEPGWRGSVAP
jgi:phage antirepressor YoqD-like protein